MVEKLFAAEKERTAVAKQQDRPGSVSPADQVVTSLGKKLSS